MFRLIAIAFAVIALNTAAFAQPAQDTRLPAEDLLADLALAEEAYARIHPGYTRYANPDELSTAWTTLRQRIETQGEMSVGEFYLELQSILVEIRCDHTKVELPRALRQERETSQIYLPFRWQWIEERAIVTHPGTVEGLNTGDEIIMIDDQPIADLVNEVIDYIPFDGETRWARATGLADSSEFEGGAIDHFGAMLNWPEPFGSAIARTADGEERRVDFERLNFADYRNLRSRFAPAENFKDAVHFEPLNADTALLRVDTFVNYRDPVDPDDLYRPIFDELSKTGVSNLILDLRNNGGGSGDAQSGLIAYLIDERQTLYSDMRVATLDMDGLRDHLWTWDSRALSPNPLGFRTNDDGTYSLRRFVDRDLRPIRPQRQRFEGQLIMLIGPSNSSASTTIATFLKDHADAVLVGAETGGSSEGPTAGLMFTLILPNSDVRTRIPFFRYYNNVDNAAVGLGVSPDIEAGLTVEAYRNGEDPALEAALAFIRQ